MNYTTVEHTAKSNDEQHTLYGKIYVPIGTPRATVQIIHGMSEHIELYEELSDKLAKQGFAVIIYDQLGHGKTAGALENLGFFAEENGDRILVEDAFGFVRELLEDYSGIPHILFGHSMGSFVARICAEKYPQMADALIIAGTGGPQKAAPLGLAITDLGSKVKGTEYRSDLTQKAFMDIYNTEFKEEKNDYSWLTRDPETILRHTNDERFNFTFSLKAMNDLVMLSTECNSEQWFDEYRKDLPTLIISGEKDPVGENGKGVMEVFKNLESRGVSDLSFKLYRDCRHELLNELNKEEIMDEIICWINNRITTDQNKKPS
ncbi:MAG: alpha/beta fold hydrolase [Clostridia bacterium]|nr:alpha/beta fold hydrolase [Clostridia bacterium]